MYEPYPTIRDVIMEPVYLYPVALTLEDVDSQPILDGTGNLIRDSEGRVIYGS